MIKIYKDISANAIFIEDSNGVQYLNSLEALDSNGFVCVKDKIKNIEILSNIAFDEFFDKDENPYGANVTEVVDALNAIFEQLGFVSYLGFSAKPIRAGGATPTAPFTTTSTTPVLVHTWSFTTEEAMALEFTVGLRYKLDVLNRDAVFRWDLDGVTGLSVNQEPKDVNNNSFTTLVDVENTPSGNHTIEFYANIEPGGGAGSPQLEISTYLIVARRVENYQE